MSEITFDEDKSFGHTLESEIRVPETGFEGWFYKKFPGGYFFKRAILYGIIILLFTASIFFIALGRFNIQTSKIELEDRATTSTK